MFWTYALYSASSGKIYVGQTCDLQRRLDEHNGLGEHVTWTNKYKPWELFYYETFETRAEAMNREKQLKTGSGREFLRNKRIAGWSPPSADSSLGS